MAEGKLAGSHLLKNNQKEILEVADIFGDWGDKGGHGAPSMSPESPVCPGKTVERKQIASGREKSYSFPWRLALHAWQRIECLPVVLMKRRLYRKPSPCYFFGVARLEPFYPEISYVSFPADIDLGKPTL